MYGFDIFTFFLESLSKPAPNLNLGGFALTLEVYFGTIRSLRTIILELRRQLLRCGYSVCAEACAYDAQERSRGVRPGDLIPLLPPSQPPALCGPPHWFLSPARRRRSSRSARRGAFLGAKSTVLGNIVIGNLHRGGVN